MHEKCRKAQGRVYVFTLPTLFLWKRTGWGEDKLGFWAGCLLAMVCRWLTCVGCTQHESNLWGSLHCGAACTAVYTLSSSGEETVFFWRELSANCVGRPMWYEPMLPRAVHDVVHCTAARYCCSGVGAVAGLVPSCGAWRIPLLTALDRREGGEPCPQT